MLHTYIHNVRNVTKSALFSDKKFDLTVFMVH